ncbi:MAG: hypothetical protein OXG07_05885 [Anaerolineaceae bacterium]|nr:hypothetical protein [Anaerolineaceae bacterium]MCY3906710.1 hypothetical protein [Anaerolineaceae bacterium]
MAVRARPFQFGEQEAPRQQPGLWLKDRRWDMNFIILSVLLVPVPYLLYLFGVNQLGLDPDLSRNTINAFVAVAVGGPHMMSTFLRTGLDRDFSRRYPMLLRSSIIIPLIVVALAFLNLTLLLTIFFFWAMLHVLHQATYVTELYNHREHKVMKRPEISTAARLIDYALILTCLFPMAALKISEGSFRVGTNDLTAVIPHLFQDTWFFTAAAAVFLVALGLYAVKTVMEYRAGQINWPKTIFITLTVAVFFPLAGFENLDTAFQGANTWHSFQYLPLTFYIIKLKQRSQPGFDRQAPLVARFSRGENTRGLYVLSTLMLGGSLVIFLLVYAIAGTIIPDIDPNRHFDIAYYTAILSFLWIHYYHDHFLFTDFEALDEAHYS